MTLNLIADSLFRHDETNRESLRATSTVTESLPRSESKGLSVLPAWQMPALLLVKLIQKHPPGLARHYFFLKNESSLKVVLLLDLLNIWLFSSCCWGRRCSCGGGGEQGWYLRSRSSVRSVGFCWAFSGVGWEACSCSKRSRWISWRISLNVLVSQSVHWIGVAEETLRLFTQLENPAF